MGASASTAGGELEELVACTYILGQALASMSFPDMSCRGARVPSSEQKEEKKEKETDGGLRESQAGRAGGARAVVTLPPA